MDKLNLVQDVALVCAYFKHITDLNAQQNRR